ncbi:hypothetical protein WHR41_06152 [Cladosporium halotolerans]|uniref:Uncharacterized protein n=1 Tax=Cladosporium halotolerans TaxID=1052096 RepID=A0AB34KML7_9PEZI
MPLLTPGRLLFLLANISYSLGAFLADWNATHIHNPLWPPHAKFHNGQTMSLAVLLALTSTYFAFRPAFTALSKAEERHSVIMAAVSGSLYCGAGLSAILYPGTDWFDAEFRREGVSQREVFAGVVGLCWVAGWLEVRRIGGVKGE